RWAEICRRYHLVTHQLNVKWGHAVDPVDLANELEQKPNIKAVLTQACETSTATLHPIQSIAAIVREYENKILIVDAITAVGAMELEMDAWGLDVVIGGSQKAFMLPAGLSFIALSEKAWRAHQSSKLPKFYWDLTTEKTAMDKGESHFSTSVPMIRALEFVLTFLTGDEKLKTRNRIQSLA